MRLFSGCEAMPIILMLLGLLVIIAAFRGEETTLGRLVAGDMTGLGGSSFLWWMISLGGIASVGYVPRLRPFAVSFAALVGLAMLLSNRGFFAQLTIAAQISQSGGAPAQSNQDFNSWAQIGNNVSTSAGGSSGGGGGGIMGLLGAAGVVAAPFTGGASLAVTAATTAASVSGAGGGGSTNFAGS